MDRDFHRRRSALAELVDDEHLRSPAFATRAARESVHAEIDGVLAGWTRRFEKVELAELLQAHGIAAGPATKVSDFVLDPPLKLAGHMAGFVAGLHAALAVYAAVYGVRAGVEDGVQIDISAQETFLQHWSRHIGQYTYNGTGSRRDQRTFVGQLDTFVGDEWREPRARAERWPKIQPHFEQSLASRTRSDWFAAAAERGLIFGPVQDLNEVLHAEQYAARGFFKTADFNGERVAFPGLPFNWESSDRGGPGGVRHDPV